MAWTDYIDDVGGGAIGGAATGAAIGSVVPVIGTGIGAGVGGLLGGLTGYFSERERQKALEPVRGTIDQYLNGGVMGQQQRPSMARGVEAQRPTAMRGSSGSMFDPMGASVDAANRYTSALIPQGQQWALGGGGGDPQRQMIARDWLSGGGGVDPQRQMIARDWLSGSGSDPGMQALAGQFLQGSDFGGDPGMAALAGQWAGGRGGVDFNQGLAQQFLQGGVDPSTMAMLQRTTGRYYDKLREQQGASAARRGIANSTIAQRMLDETYDSERNAIANAVAQTSLARQNLGLGMLGQADASIFARQNLGSNAFARQQAFDLAGHGLDLDYGRTGVGILSDDAARRMGYQQMGLNALAGADARRMGYQQMGLNALAGEDARDIDYRRMGLSVLSEADTRKMIGDKFGFQAGLQMANNETARNDATWAGIAELGGGLFSEYLAGQRRNDQNQAFAGHSNVMQDMLGNITRPRTTFPSYNPQGGQVRIPSYTTPQITSRSPFLPTSGTLNQPFSRRGVTQQQRPNLISAKASNLAGGGGVKSPFLSQGSTLNSAFGGRSGRNSILQSNQGAGGVRMNPLSNRRPQTP